MYMHAVTTAQDKSDFLRLPDRIHKGNSHYIPALDRDIEAVFDPKQNKFFKNGTCQRWLLLDGGGQIIGRIAAFINPMYIQQQPTGGIGFFDCIDDQAAAGVMFDHCRSWLAAKGVQAMDGPINFGERINWWGLLSEGFESPLYGMNYHPPYYRQLFECYGFKLQYRQNCYSYDLKTRLPEKFHKLKRLVELDTSIRFRQLDKKYLEKYARDFAIIYNKGWASHGEGKTMEEAEAVKLFRAMKAVIDQRVIFFVYQAEQPVACWLNLPHLNDYFKRLSPKLGLVDLLRFLMIKNFRPTDKLIGVLFGIVPAFQNKGIAAYMIVKGLERIAAAGRYQKYEMQWIGDFNPKMINVATNMGAGLTRRYVTYRLHFECKE